MENQLSSNVPGAPSFSAAAQADRLRFVANLTARSGPEPHEYRALNAWFAEVHALALAGAVTAAELGELRLAFGDAMSVATLQGFVCEKPHGYAGDFEIIDRIYQRHVSPDPRLARWDRYFHAQPAVTAVRNRKDYFHELLRAHRRRVGGAPLKVLVVGSGPGRDLHEHLSACPDEPVRFECVEIDADAIAHAAALNVRFADRMVFHRRHALRFRTDERFDLVWAAGLFDYFDDRLFKVMLARLNGMVAAGGELVIGNFCRSNPNRAYMEFGQWMLHHRTAGELRALAGACGVGDGRIRVGLEPEGVNLFLHVAYGVPS